MKSFLCCVSGFGYGLCSITCVTQLALYFSTYAALANAIGLSGSTVFGVISPYLGQYLMDEYGWRGAVLVLGGISLNASAFGALLHPIQVTREESAFELQPLRESRPKRNRTVSSFLRKYWLGLWFLFNNFLVGFSMYLPNVYIVPFALEMHLGETQSVILLSVISVGDFVGRFFSGLIMSKINFFKEHILHLGCFCIWLMSIVQLVPALTSNFWALLFYCLLYGCSFGGLTVISVTAVAAYTHPKITPTVFSCFFASGGAALLISGVLSGKKTCTCFKEYTSRIVVFFFRDGCGLDWNF